MKYFSKSYIKEDNSISSFMWWWLAKHNLIDKYIELKLAKIKLLKQLLKE